MEQDHDKGEKPRRLPNGRFPPRVSGNLNGRPRKLKRKHSNAYNNARAAIAVAEISVQMTVDGKATETTAYDAALRKVYQQAMNNNDMRAMKMFLDSVDSATAVLMEHSELVKFLIDRDEEEQKQVAKILKLFPKSTGSGVHHRLDDGSIVPWKWAESINKLEQLEAKEAELVAREHAIRVREADLGE